MVTVAPPGWMVTVTRSLLVDWGLVAKAAATSSRYVAPTTRRVRVRKAGLPGGGGDGVRVEHGEEEEWEVGGGRGEVREGAGRGCPGLWRGRGHEGVPTLIRQRLGGVACGDWCVRVRVRVRGGGVAGWRGGGVGG